MTDTPATDGQEHAVVWRFLPHPGHEHARLSRIDGLWRLAGSAVFAHASAPCRLDYEVHCDEGWKTLRAAVEGWIGGRRVEMEMAADDGRWTRGGDPCPDVDECVDADLGFSPSTNLLPIRRLGLDVGESAVVRAAWLRFPDLSFRPLDQRYTRTGDRTWRYESGGGAFTADLEVDAAGMVRRYGDVWIAEAGMPD